MSQPPKITVGFCTYNRADSLLGLVQVLRSLECPHPFDILVINNNSRDHTASVLDQLAQEEGAPLRWVLETEQGIVPARNRLIAETLNQDYLLMLDDDELPAPEWLAAGFHALHNEGAQCVSGPITVDFRTTPAPDWMNAAISGFLGEVDYGPEAYWNTHPSQRFYTGNIGYRLSLFRENPELRFDTRYNRAGEGIGGGSDTHMYGRMLEMGVRLRYRPEMRIYHHVDPWKLKRSYFLKLHHREGVRIGRYSATDYPRTLLGVPPFMLAQAVRHSAKTLGMMLRGDAEALRQGMNATHAWGMVRGLYLRHRDRKAGDFR
jgi:succinoglycan biosynthesis protein ExoM